MHSHVVMGRFQNKFVVCVHMCRYGIFLNSTSSHPRVRVRRLPMLPVPLPLLPSVTARGASTHTKSSSYCVDSGLWSVLDIDEDAFEGSMVRRVH